MLRKIAFRLPINSLIVETVVSFPWSKPSTFSNIWRQSSSVSSLNNRQKHEQVSHQLTVGAATVSGVVGFLFLALSVIFAAEDVSDLDLDFLIFLSACAGPGKDDNSTEEMAISFSRIAELLYGLALFQENFIGRNKSVTLISHTIIWLYSLNYLYLLLIFSVWFIYFYNLYFHSKNYKRTYSILTQLYCVFGLNYHDLQIQGWNYG